MLRSPTIRVPKLKKLLTEIGASSRKLRLFDAAYTLREPANHEEFLRKSYGNFGKLMGMGAHPDFNKERLPGAVHFNLDIASFPGKYERASLYPPELFEEYIRMLGVNKGDAVVVYGRGPFGGMLFAARAWWLLKMYGLEEVAVLEGGIDKWKEEGGATVQGTKGDVSVVYGDWEAAEPRKDLIVLYDEMKSNGLFQRLKQVNMLDCRPAEEFDGRNPLAFPPNGSSGARLSGLKSLPLSHIIADNGELRNTEEIRTLLLSSGFDSSLPTMTICNGGTQAALLGLSLEKAGVKWSLFNGSLREVSKRDPSLICETAQ